MSRQMAAMQQSLNAVLTKEYHLMSDVSALGNEITTLTKSVAAETTINASAVTLIKGFPALIGKAVADAIAAGATPAQLAALTDLSTVIEADTAALAEAITANTPAAPSGP